MLVARFRIERLQIRRLIRIVAGADNDVITDHHRNVRRKILLLERSDFLLPHFAAGLRIQTHNPVVMQFEVNVVVPHTRAARAGRGATAILPVVVPQHRTVARVDRINIVLRSAIENAVHKQNPAAEARGPARVDLTRSKTARNNRAGCGNHHHRHRDHPGRRLRRDLLRGGRRHPFQSVRNLS